MDSGRAIPKHELTSFAIAGAIGFGVDALGFVFLFHVLNFGHYVARLLAFMIAVTITWLLNRTYTFRVSRKERLHKEYLAYLTAQSFGVLVNFGVFSFCIVSSEVLKQYPVVALVFGSGAAMVVNFISMKLVVFKSRGAEKPKR
jgi:putative flippase GtrA